jgi:hypothetical protein
MDAGVAEVVLSMERRFEALLEPLEGQGMHLPSRLRSLLWILASLRIMAARGEYIADEGEVQAELTARLPALEQEAPPLAAALA